MEPGRGRVVKREGGVRKAGKNLSSSSAKPGLYTVHMSILGAGRTIMEGNNSEMFGKELPDCSRVQGQLTEGAVGRGASDVEGEEGAESFLPAGPQGYLGTHNFPSPG